jgi:hypothetical protein
MAKNLNSLGLALIVLIMVVMAAMFDYRLEIGTQGLKFEPNAIGIVKPN